MTATGTNPDAAPSARPPAPSPFPSPVVPAGDPAGDPATTTRRLRRYLRFLGGDDAAACDCAQDALVAGLARFGEAPAPLPWLLTAARNAFRMQLRRRGREVAAADLDALHAEWERVAGPDGGDERLLALRECLRDLPPRARRALELRYRDDAPRAAMARELGLGDEGVKSLLVRLRAALAACVQRRMRP
ncbi:MAG: RNA polymerase sigma factor [Planctomycetota bacterium]